MIQRATSAMIDEPFIYETGRVVISDQLKTTPEFIALIPIFEKQRQRVQDLFVFIHFIYCPRSIFRHMPEEDRVKRVLTEGRIADKVWLKKALDQQVVRDFIDFYCEIAMTPGQRLYLGLVDNVKRVLNEATAMKGSMDQKELDATLNKGKALYKQSQEIDKMIREEQMGKVRGGYTPRKFENRPDTPLKLAS